MVNVPQPTAPMSAIAPPAQGWQGLLDLHFSQRQGETYLRQERLQAPLKIQRPFFPEGPGVCHCVALHTAGGIVGGDRLTQTLSLDAQTQVLLTTAAATKVYASEARTASQDIQLTIGAAACLEWLPQETIAFQGAHYRQRLRVDLAPGARWLGWELTRFGRSARGEEFVEGDWRSHTEVWQGEVPLWLDRQWLPGNTTVFHSPHGLASQPVVGTFAFIGQAVDLALLAQIRTLAETLQMQAHTGVSRLPQGLCCRYRGASVAMARQWFVAIWQVLRPWYLGRAIVIPRVWPG
ncbi:urease accessory protein UreD [Trichothermofontia sp.]